MVRYDWKIMGRKRDYDVKVFSRPSINIEETFLENRWIPGKSEWNPLQLTFEENYLEIYEEFLISKTLNIGLFVCDKLTEVWSLSDFNVENIFKDQNKITVDLVYKNVMYTNKGI